MSKNGASAPEHAIRPETPPLRFDENKVVRIGKTRVTLDTVVAAFQNGDTPEEIARNYDTIALSEVYQAIGFYLAHKTDVDAYLAQRHSSRESLRKDLEAGRNLSGIRQRLLARKQRAA
jgi:uncharacterized protein (DUF433 family)